MPKRRTSRATVGICALLAGAVLWATGLLFVQLKPYWVAKYRGQDAHLRGAMLALAPLGGSNLMRADLRGSSLWAADLREAWLRAADLTGADLRNAQLRGADLHAVSLKRA